MKAGIEERCGLGKVIKKMRRKTAQKKKRRKNPAEKLRRKNWLSPSEQVLRQQTRASEYVREGVEKNKVSLVNMSKVIATIQGDCGSGEPDH